MKPTLIALLIALLAAPAAAKSSNTALNPDMKGFPKWTAVLAREQFSPAKQPFTGDLKALLYRLHQHYRSIPYVEDIDNFRQQDLWQTREEMQAKGSGDCEDFAIAEYYDLAEAGVPEEQMHILVVMVNRTQEIHAVLRVGDWFLDRRAERVMPLSELSNYYLPIYGINRHGWARGLPE